VSSVLDVGTLKVKVRTAYATYGLLDLECKMCSVYLIFNVLWAGTG
jgi:hypothetical protein